ncbi:MAG: efflux RND transporter periplasmic adaptor subunit [Kiritimatiellales bacterium]|nr:efflux RND transporter periplasmic adaptor subunit [Kiritimatiellales bacterium]
MSLLKKSIKIIVPILIVLIAVMIGRIIITTTKKPQKKRPQKTAYTVAVQPLKAGSQAVKLKATGTVAPAVEIALRTRVAGEIVEVAPEFIDGGAFQQGEVMLKIDPIDYQLALELKKAALAEAEYQLQLEKGQGEIAAREWELLGPDDNSSKADRSLALRVPHLKYRTAKLEAAKAELENAKLDLARTQIRAPFNAVVVERKTDLGTQAAIQDALATLAGSDRFYVRASIPVDRLKWIKCDPDNGSLVTVTRITGDVRQGRAIRLESALEEKGRMARVIVAVENPTQGEHPMLLNEYVHIEIEGNPIEKAYHIPRVALHGDRQVWLASPENTLEIRDVEVGWRDATDVIVTGGLNNGERLILTNLSTPVNGMKLRIEGDPVPEEKGKGQGAGKGKQGKGSKSNE